MRNDFYIKEGFPSDWSNEIKISDGKNTIICDAWFKRSGKFHFLEVDSTQKMKENRSKIDVYSNFYKTERLSKHLGYFPVLIWLTTTEYRRQQIKELCKDLACEVYTSNDIR